MSTEIIDHFLVDGLKIEIVNNNIYLSTKMVKNDMSQDEV